MLLGLLASIDDATSQLVPCCCRFKMTRFEEQNVNIYIFKSLCRHQSFQQKSPELLCSVYWLEAT